MLLSGFLTMSKLVFSGAWILHAIFLNGCVSACDVGKYFFRI